ncbi:MAG: NAD-dependent epimerase/dehydratase family protein [Deltaproteobacteria bacterium]|nr:NAD-dependent epimerase/dehydratase family protein [Deltaproteobacteria bacterium]
MTGDNEGVRSNRVLVTGATGFLGHHLVEILASRGNEVFALCRNPRAARERLDQRVAHVVLGDVLDPISVSSAANECLSVYHCAGSVSRDPADAEHMHRIHVEGTRTVLEACLRQGIRRVVIASTSGTVAIGDDPNRAARESDPTPLELVHRYPYYRAKLYAERWALAFSAKHGMDVVSVNPSLLLGPGDEHLSSTEDVRKFLDGQVHAVPCGGLSFVDARDAALAMVLAMSHGEAGQRYLVGAANLTFEAFFGRLARIAGVAPPRVRLPRTGAAGRLGVRALGRLASRLGGEPPLGEQAFEMGEHYWYVDSSRAERELGWVARDPNETLYDTVADLRARGVVWPEPEPSAAEEWT